MFAGRLVVALAEKMMEKEVDDIMIPRKLAFILVFVSITFAAPCFAAGMPEPLISPQINGQSVASQEDDSHEEGAGRQSAPIVLGKADSPGEFSEDNAYYEDDDVLHIADPLEPLNRLFFHFNDKLYFWLLKPAAQGYSAVVPEDVRIGVRNVFDNAATPVRVVNNLLQLKLKSAGIEMLRFCANTFFGIGGLFDVAKTEFGLRSQDEDLGQTLGVWGFGPGFYLNLPVFGPSSLRDTIGLSGDFFLDPVNYITPGTDRLAVKAGDRVNRTSLFIGDYEDVKKDAIDPYMAFRDIYFQYRNKKVRE